MNIFQQIGALDPLELTGAVIGLLYLFLEYKANIWLWPVGVLMNIVYVIIFYQSEIYGDMGIYIYYFFASIYGWYIWKKATNQTEKILILHTPIKYIWKLIVAFILIFFVIAFVLIQLNSQVPYLDSLTTTLSILAMWMLAHKYIEQWLLWIVVNLVSIGLYSYKQLDITALLFIVYSIVPFFGYFKWRKIMAKQQEI